MVARFHFQNKMTTRAQCFQHNGLALSLTHLPYIGAATWSAVSHHSPGLNFRSDTRNRCTRRCCAHLFLQPRVVARRAVASTLSPNRTDTRVLVARTSPHVLSDVGIMRCQIAQNRPIVRVYRQCHIAKGYHTRCSRLTFVTPVLCTEVEAVNGQCACEQLSHRTTS